LLLSTIAAVKQAEQKERVKEMSIQELTQKPMVLEVPTHTLYLYGKNGTLTHPTKAYPTPTIVKLTAELIKDFGEGVAVWKFPAYEDKSAEMIWLSQHNNNGTIALGRECRSQENAFEQVARLFVWREYNEKKSELYREHREALAELEAEYKGRI
jgi:hypothetical protein